MFMKRMHHSQRASFTFGGKNGNMGYNKYNKGKHAVTTCVCGDSSNSSSGGFSSLIRKHKLKFKHKPTPLNPNDFVTIIKETHNHIKHKDNNNTNKHQQQQQQLQHSRVTYKKSKLSLSNYTTTTTTQILPELKCKCQLPKTTTQLYNPKYEQQQQQQSSSLSFKIKPTLQLIPYHKYKTKLSFKSSSSYRHALTSLPSSTPPQLSNIKYKEHTYESIAGMKMYITKENQDALFIIDKTDATTTLKVFAVFDGHGDSGTRTSHDLSEFFQSYYTTDTIVHSTEESVINSIRTLINKATTYIKSKPYNTDYSGSTLNMVTLYSTVKDPIIKIITTNIGDSRCIAISYTNNNVIQLTKDHKPDDTAERERIESKGGEVARVNWANFGPFRVWFKGKNYPGLAMSRSIGDNIAKSIGVINEPDITIYNANALNVKAIVIATDGVWEFMNNNRIRDIVIEYYKADDCKGAAKKIVAEARKLWEVNNKMGIDDITCIVIYFKK